MLQLGDTLTEGEKLQFTGLPFFAPEIFYTVEVKDPIRNKQLRTGLQQLGEEGAIQVFRPHQGGPLLLGAVGPLQLDVVAHRLEGEYQAQARMTPSNYKLARWVTAADPAELERFIEANALSRGLRRGRCARGALHARVGAASRAGDLAEDRVPHHARARWTGGALEPAGGLNAPRVIPGTGVAALTTLAMLAFAGNSLLCRIALRETAMDAASFTAIRVISGALALGLIVRLRDGPRALGGSWPSALALFVYAAGFSYAYLGLTAAMGALLLFGAVQATMISRGLVTGERLTVVQLAGLVLALAGLVALLLPGLAAPPPMNAALMIAAGIAWGIYSLRGRGAGDPTVATAGNFIRAVAFAVVLAAAAMPWASLDFAGIGYAVASGAITSGIGYAIWYTALKGLQATHAATVQLSVPAIAAFGGVILLGESLTLRLVAASIAILGGIALVILARSSGRPQRP